MNGDFIQTNCPNCTAQMEISSDGKKLTCPYCSTIVLINTASNSNNDANQEKSAAYKAKKIKEITVATDYIEPIMIHPNPDMLPIWKHMNDALNNNMELSEIIKNALKQVSDSTQFATPDYSKDIWNKINKKAKYESDETPYLFMNGNIIGSGRQGIIITDKRIIKIGTMGTKSIYYNDLEYLNGSSGDFIYFNDSWTCISTYGISAEGRGYIAALIAKLAKNANGPEYRLKFNIASKNDYIEE